MGAKRPVPRKLRGELRREVHIETHWWDDHPPADPEAEPLYAAALEGHLTGLALS